MPTMPPATAAVRGAVRDLLRARMDAGAISAGDLVLVACSGGADSLALAAATAFVAPRLGLRAGAVNVDHGMQAGSAQVSRTAVDQCRDLGLAPALVVGPTGPAPTGLGPEATAREVRYPALAGAADRTGAVAVLLGHTLDDQAETVLLALARGSGTRAVAGMDPVRGRYLRPLLGVRRAQTVAACTEAGVQPWDDPANAAAGPWRTAAGTPLLRAGLRERVLPELIQVLGPGAVEGLARTADLARADADLLEDLAGQAYHRVRAAGGTGEPPARASSAVVLSVDALGREPAALRTRVLRAAALDAGSPPGALGSVHVRAVDELVTHWRGQGPLHLPGGVRVSRRCGNLVFDLPAGSSQPAVPTATSRRSGDLRGRQHHG